MLSVMPTPHGAADARRLVLATRAGTTATVVTAWLLLFLLAPYLSAHAHVGHEHPPETAEHAHALHSVLTSLPAVVHATSPRLDPAPDALIVPGSVGRVSGDQHRLPPTRAPPLAIV